MTLEIAYLKAFFYLKNHSYVSLPFYYRCMCCYIGSYLHFPRLPSSASVIWSSCSADQKSFVFKSKNITYCVILCTKFFINDLGNQFYGQSFRLKLHVNRTLQYFISKQTTHKVTLGILLYFLSHQMNLKAAAMHPLMAIVGYGSNSRVFEYFLLYDTTVKVGNQYPLEQVYSLWQILFLSNFWKEELYYFHSCEGKIMSRWPQIKQMYKMNIHVSLVAKR